MKKNKTLWIISELFYPNESATAYILTEMAKKFTEVYNVNVICADTNYEGDKTRVTEAVEDMANITIHTVGIPELDKNNIVKRLARFLIASKTLYKKANELVRPGDVVFAVTNPAFLLPYMKKLKKKKGIEYYLLVHDVFPENALSTGVMKSKALYSALKRVFDKSYAAADKIFVLGDDMKEVVAKKIGTSEKLYICENWGADNVMPRERENDGKIVIQYAGNIGRVQGIEELVDIAAKIDNPQLVFDFWGSGALVPYLQKTIEKNKLTNVRVRGSYNRNTQQNDVLNDCDIAIVGLAKGMKGLGVPSKTYNILAAGKPIIYIGDTGSEIYNMVDRKDLGVVFSWDQKCEIIGWLNRLSLADYTSLREKGLRARALYESDYTEVAVLNRLMSIVNS